MARKLSRAEFKAMMSERGKLGGKARKAALTPERRREIARAAALAMHKAQGTLKQSS